MEETYETWHFELTISEIKNVKSIDIFCLQDYDIASRGGFGLVYSEDAKDGYGRKYDENGRLSNPISYLRRARTERDKDRLLYDVWLTVVDIMNSYC